MPDTDNFPIPPDLTPPTICFQFEMPNTPEWKRIFVGLLAQPTYWFNWQRDEARSGKVLAAYWTKLFDQIDWSQMSCCPEFEIRLNADGSMSVSFDGGATWEPAGSRDPRSTSPQFPPIPGADDNVKKCKAANSVVRQLKDVQIGYSSQIGTVTTVLAMAALLVGLAVLVFATAGLSTFLIGAFFELGAALLDTTSAAYDALFTDDDWNWVLCEIYCHMDTTGQIIAGDFTTIQADFDSHFTGNAALTFSSTLNAWGVDGLNNAAKIPTADNLDCSICTECAEGCDLTPWTFFDAESGNTVTKTEFYWEVEAVVRTGSSQYYVIITSPGADDCCAFTDIATVSGSIDLRNAWTHCGDDPDSVVDGTYRDYPIGTGTNALLIQSTVAFTVGFSTAV